MIELNTNVVYIVSILVAIGLFFKYVKNNDESELKCVISHVDGNTYCVRERNKIMLVVDLLAKTTQNMKKLVDHLHEQYPDRENVKRLYKNFDIKKVKETLPTSRYTAYSENKERIAFCVTTRKNNSQLIDENTLMFVALHELSHVATKSIGHTEEFWNNFKFILKSASSIGIYKPEDYSKTPKSYCGTKIKDNPYFA